MKLSELIEHLKTAQTDLAERYSSPEYSDPLITVVYQGMTDEVISVKDLYCPAFGGDKELWIVCTDDLTIY
jgi:hypothetical protein